MADTATEIDRRSARRAARRAENRTEILDAAETVFASAGVHEGTLRAIAAESGFSTAAIYLFFENKQHLLAETVTRRGDELNAALAEAAAQCGAPMDALHSIVDATVSFFATHPKFQMLLRKMHAGTAMVGPALAAYETEVEARFAAATTLLSGTVAEGQRLGEIRDGDPEMLAKLYMALVNEFVYLTLDPGVTEPRNDKPLKDFHQLVDGALRRPGRQEHGSH